MQVYRGLWFRTFSSSATVRSTGSKLSSSVISSLFWSLPEESMSQWSNRDVNHSVLKWRCEKKIEETAEPKHQSVKQQETCHILWCRSHFVIFVTCEARVPAPSRCLWSDIFTSLKSQPSRPHLRGAGVILWQCRQCRQCRLGQYGEPGRPGMNSICRWSRCHFYVDMSQVAICPYAMKSYEIKVMWSLCWCPRICDVRFWG